MLSIELLDEELAQHALAGDFRAFEELVRRYHRPLLKFAYDILHNYDDASDVLQQTLIQLHASLPQRCPTASFKSWAFVITRNKCLDQLRKRRMLTFTQLEFEDPEQSELEEIYDPTPLPQDLMEIQHTRQILKEAIATLPNRYRAVVMLRYTSDLSFNQIGQLLNIPEGSAKTFFQRAKLQLRRYLKDRLYPGLDSYLFCNPLAEDL